MNPNEHALAVAELAAHALNHLDGWPDPDDAAGCCYRCCGACHALFLLDYAGMLDDVLRPFMREYDSWVWWVDGRLDRQWLERGWRDTKYHPVHGTINGVRVATLNVESLTHQRRCCET